MNNISLQEIMDISRPYIQESFSVDNLLQLNNLTNFTQESTKKTILFYGLTNEEKFLQQFGKIEYGLLIVNKKFLRINQAKNTIVIENKDFLKLQKIYCDLFYPNKKKLKLIGVTGTNGKTTTTCLCSQIAKKWEKKAYAVGTTGVLDGHETIAPLTQTTVNYIDLRKIIHQYQDKISCLFLEISSHGLKQNRLYDLKLDIVAWTNFTQDHLDYHKTMDDYFRSKGRILNYSKEQNILVARDQTELQKKIKSMGVNIEIPKSLKERGLTFTTNFLQAKFNQSNLELALEICEKLWPCINDFQGKEGEAPQQKGIDLNTLQAPKGRFSLIELGFERFVIIDYAHTPDALKNILISVKEGFRGYRIKALFGCGGDRDVDKRKMMGQVAAGHADYCYLTSDNPRTEDPQVIIDGIKEGLLFQRKEASDHIYYAHIDRKLTITKALRELKEKEILVIAGKGHEEYQDILGQKVYFSDFKIVEEYSDD